MHYVIGFRSNIQVTDLNGDGKSDLFTSDRVYLGDGRGGLTLTATYTFAEKPRLLYAGDFNSDGRSDLVVVEPPGTQVWFYPSLGTALAPPVALATRPGVGAVLGFQLNRDGALDLALSHDKAPNLSVLLGNGRGGFAAPLDVDVPIRAYSLAAGDLNADGAADLMISGPRAQPNTQSAETAVLFGNGGGALTVGPIWSSFGSGAKRLIAADYTEDAFLDLGLSTFAGSTLMASRGPADLVAPVYVPRPDDVRKDYQQNCVQAPMAVVDFNNDRYPDIVTTNNTRRDITVALSDGRGGFLPPAYHVVKHFPCNLATADLNGDGFVDLATLLPDYEEVQVLYGDGLGGVRGTSTHAAKGSALISADLDGDGRQDLVVSSGRWLQNRGRLGLGAARSLGPANVSGIPAAADLDRDGDLDLALLDSDTLKILVNSGTGSFRVTQDLPSAMAVAIVAGDVNGDGAPDFLASNPVWNDASGVSLVINDGKGTMSADRGIDAKYPTGVALGDLNGDRISEAIVVSGSPARLSVVPGTLMAAAVKPYTWLSRGFQRFGSASDTQSVLIADVNVDGKPDVVTYGSFSFSVAISYNLSK